MGDFGVFSEGFVRIISIVSVRVDASAGSRRKTEADEDKMHERKGHPGEIRALGSTNSRHF